jgi:predicted dehydrogenase
MSRLQIAIAGAGLMGMAHARVIGQSSQCEVCALIDPAPQAAQQASRLGVPCYSRIDEMLARHSPDGIIIASPNQLHAEHALQCIERRLPMLIEKPMTHDLATAQLLADRLKRAGHEKVLVGHHRAHSSIVRQTRQVIESGRLGRLVSLTATALFHKPDLYFQQAPWRQAPGGGPILINLIHEVHTLRSFCGEIAEINAMTSHAIRHFQVEDTAVINLRFVNGVLGQLTVSDAAASPRSWEQTSGENTVYPQHKDEDCYHITGTLGSLSVPTMRLKTYAGEAVASWHLPFQSETIELQQQDPLVQQLAHFADVIEARCQPLVTVQDGLENLRVIQTIEKAIGLKPMPNH